LSDIKKFNRCENRLRQQGYSDYYISGDAEVVAQSVPCKCGLRYRYLGLIHTQRNDYRAFQICDNCNTGREF
jgi:hypothetical protein